MADTVIARHDYEAQQDDELNLKKGDIVQVTDFSNPDWWIGKKQDGTTGLFPSNFVEANDDKKDEAPIPTETKPTTTTTTEDEQKENVEETTEEEPVKQASQTIIGMARVMEDYAMQNDDELTLHRGSIININEKLDDDWFKGEINGKHGKFPSKYVEEIDIPGRPDIGAAGNSQHYSDNGSSTTENKGPAGGFKLAAFGVKQGGIGSLLAGGFPQLKKTSPPKQQSSSTNDNDSTSSPVSVSSNRTSAIDSVSSPVLNDSPTLVKKSQVKVIVLHPYDAENEDELTLIRGEYIDIINQNLEEEGWWQGKNERGQIGIFPNNFVKEVDLEQHATPPVRISRKSVTSVGSNKSMENSPRPSSVASLSRLPPLPDSRPTSIAATTTTTTTSPSSSISNITNDIIVQSPPIKEEEEENQVPEQQQQEKENVDTNQDEQVVTDVEPKVEDVEKEQPENVDSLKTNETPKEEKVDEPLKDDQEPVTTPTAADVTPSTTETQSAELEKEEELKQAEVESKPIAAVVNEEEEEENETPKVEEEKEKEETVVEVKDEIKNEDDTSSKENESVEKEVDVEEKEKEEIIEKKPEFGSLPTAGPRLTSPARTSRPTQRSSPRRPPTTTANEPSQTELLQQEIEKTPEPEKKESAEESPVSPPPKPVKPIFAKFPTPFAGMAGGNNENPLKNLKPVQRRMFEPTPAHESSSSHQNEENNNNDQKENSQPIPPKPAGVKNLASRFAGIPSSGGNEVLETKLKNFTKNEVEKLRKELALEVSKREQLEEMVQSLADKIELLQQQIHQS